jgi:dTDP-4-dehydrorhamnose 3,5-epimerase
MDITTTALEGCIILEPKVFKDARGHFMETYNKNDFEMAVGKPVDFVQDNQSFSTRGVVRALHYQIGGYAQAKLVRVLHGEVLDVAVDIRKDSPTFGQHIAVILSAKNNKQLFIPRGFAHGFVTLSATALFFYKCDNFYNKAAEGGIIYNDPTLGIDWKLPENDLIVSQKDVVLPTLENARL